MVGYRTTSANPLVQGLVEMTPGARRPHYGVDAPGIVLTFFAVAAGLLVAASAIVAAGIGGRWALPAALTMAALALIPLALGTTMTAYARIGKFRVCDFMLDMLDLGGDEAVLDVGTGRGLLAVGAARRLTQGHAVGIDVWSAKDLSGNDPRAARGNAVLEGVADRVTILDGDARALAFADRSFDAVVSLLCLHNIEEADARDGACAEVARVLRAGGRAIIGDYVPTKAYEASLLRAGLVVRPSTRHFRVALGPLWIVVADKP